MKRVHQKSRMLEWHAMIHYGEEYFWLSNKHFPLRHDINTYVPAIKNHLWRTMK